MDSLMIPMSLEIKGTTPCHAENMPVKLVRQVPLKTFLNKRVHQSARTSRKESWPWVEWPWCRGHRSLELEEDLNPLRTTSCVITAYRLPLAPVLGMMSMIHMSVRAIIGVLSVRKKNMSSGNANGKKCLKESNGNWMSGKTGCAIILRICPKCTKEMNRLGSCLQWPSKGS